MPNMFGGDQLHPAYTGENVSRDPRRVLVGNREYEIHGNGSRMYVTWEDVDGESGRIPLWGFLTKQTDKLYLPKRVERKANALLKKWEQKKRKSAKA